MVFVTCMSIAAATSTPATKGSFFLAGSVQLELNCDSWLLKLELRVLPLVVQTASNVVCGYTYAR